MDIIKERFELAFDRIKEIQKEQFAEQSFAAYFKTSAAFLESMCQMYTWIEKGDLVTAPIDALKAKNEAMYADISNENYEQSYANPAFAVERLGKEFGQILCVLYSELRSTIGPAYEQDMESFTIYMELFVEVYGMFQYEWQENKKLPAVEEVRQILYWFSSDYAEIIVEKRIAIQMEPSFDFATRIIMDSDLTDLRYLYMYGEYISENEVRTAKYMNSLPEEKIRLMADTYTEGFRIGFITMGKDISKKKNVAIHYQIGFERMIRQAIHNFRKMGLEPTIVRPALSLVQHKSVMRSGFTGANPNKQYDYDHKDDLALIMDKAYVNRRLEVTKNAYEVYKEAASYFAGPAVLEVFGEEPFAPQSKPEACVLSDEQQGLSVELRSATMEIQRQYIKEEERSFTIIAFPVPDIGEQFEEIFDEVIRINTLDYKLYQGIQQKIIDVLDQAEYVEIKGMNGNRTDLKVMMYQMQNPEKESIFENCVADVNIPVGEVFTSPKLTGTNGTLHVSKVFLNELEYKDLAVVFKDGMIAEYSCANFDTEAQNRKFLKDNLLFQRETLPLGEFAIGTNTTAYVVAQKYEIAAKLPILIAEKMGPHFAVGDTCYSHTEEMAVFNPDGKEIVARTNERSKNKEYFNCHTDITIPYDELGELSAIKKSGERITIIKNGRFILEGCEELNKPFEN